MPTPDETAFPPSPPIDIPARSSFASCPPDEGRSREESDDDDDEEPSRQAERGDHAIAQEPTPEPDASERISEGAQSQSKDAIVEDTVADLGAHTLHTTASPDAVAPDGDMQAAPGSSNPDAVLFPSQYLDFFGPDKDRVSILVCLIRDVAYDSRPGNT